jgi:hypothetical protein
MGNKNQVLIRVFVGNIRDFTWVVCRQETDIMNLEGLPSTPDKAIIEHSCQGSLSVGTRSQQ